MGELSLLDLRYMVVPRRLRWILGLQALRRVRWLQEMRGQAEIRLLGLALVTVPSHWHRRRLGAGTKRSRRDHAMLLAEEFAKDGSRTLPVRDARALSHRSH